MPQMRKIVSMATPARKRLRSRFSDDGSTDAGAADALVGEPKPTTSHSEKPTAIRPRTKPTVKRNNKRQTKPNRPTTPEPESGPPLEATSTALPNHMGGNGRELDSYPAAGTPSPVVKKNAPRLSRQGTRSSARLRGQGSTVIHEPTPIQPEIKQAKRKRGSLGEDNTVELPKKRAKRSDDQADVPAQENSATFSNTPPVDLVLSKNVVVDHLGQPADIVAEGSAVVDPPKDEPTKPRGFFPQLGDLRVAFGLGGSGP